MLWHKKLLKCFVDWVWTGENNWLLGCGILKASNFPLNKSLQISQTEKKGNCSWSLAVWSFVFDTWALGFQNCMHGSSFSLYSAEQNCKNVPLSCSRVVFNEVVQTAKYYMRDVTAVESSWLVELAPHFYKQAKVGRRKKLLWLHD